MHLRDSQRFCPHVGDLLLHGLIERKKCVLGLHSEKALFRRYLSELSIEEAYDLGD